MKGIKIIFLTILPALSNALTFNCMYFDKEVCNYNCQYYSETCKAVNMIITKPNQTVNKIFGLNRDKDQVHVLKIHDQLIRYFPMNISSFFPNIEVIQIWSSGLKTLSQKDLAPFTQLRELSVSRNEIENLSSDIFEMNQNLIKIDFSRNRLKHVGYFILKPLKHLIYVDFYQNDCINHGSQNGIEALTKKLRKKCKPTLEMMSEDLTRLNERVEMLELIAAEKSHRNRRCDSDLVPLDTLFPSIFIGSENQIEN